MAQIYSLLSQRDNMIGVSVAMESKKISEASKRDGSALKSLTVLTAIFFPATYIAVSNCIVLQRLKTYQVHHRPSSPSQPSTAPRCGFTGSSWFH
jgi:preprotein translocase subunit SecG